MATHTRRRLRIAPMTEGDLDEVMEIERLAHRSPWTRQVFLEEMGREWAHVDVLHDPASGPARAFVNWWLVRDEVHVLNVATHPDARRKGYAASLLQHVVDAAWRAGCRYITLEVRRSNAAAIHLYERFGFQRVGLRPHYYADDREDAIVMLLEKTGE